MQTKLGQIFDLILTKRQVIATAYEWKVLCQSCGEEERAGEPGMMTHYILYRGQQRSGDVRWISVSVVS